MLADSLLLPAIARDWLVLRRIHPAYLWAGGAMVAVHAIELLMITSPPGCGWRDGCWASRRAETGKSDALARLPVGGFRR